MGEQVTQPGPFYSRGTERRQVPSFSEHRTQSQSQHPPQGGQLGQFVDGPGGGCGTLGTRHHLPHLLPLGMDGPAWAARLFV